jgi:hypothetical protein
MKRMAHYNYARDQREHFYQRKGYQAHCALIRDHRAQNKPSRILLSNKMLRSDQTIGIRAENT